ncbi:NAD(P)/FAD-dependent oxidoreductase [Microbacterium sp. SY138]|uniref:NAD(P)/FAD-dependent oxidoreductase n=1 Tax=unclassified Microbacterium TaxID=2609290 RepID=UPI00321985C8
MTVHQVVILGAGAAGVAAAQVLSRRGGVAVTLVARTDETPYIRMHITGIAFGPTLAESIQAHLPEITVVRDTVTSVDRCTRTVQLSTGAQLSFDSLIVATGSHPRPLDPALPGVDDPAVTPRTLTLHTLDDADRIRNILTHRPGPKRVAVYGGGFTGAETVSALREAGHHAALISRARIPGQAAFGTLLAARIADTHRGRVTTFLGRTITALHDRGPLLGITLDDTTTLSADLLIIALGALPTAPHPFTRGVDVDDHLRSGTPGIYAAGAAVTHHDDHLGTWRIDHWADAAAQGAHAAAALLHDHLDSDDPGPYRPRSSYGALIHGTVISGIGYTTTTNEHTRFEDTLVMHMAGDTIVGVTGIDQVTAVHQNSARLHVVAA